MVTLLVTPKQAEILQLATKFGSVSLSMRNPRDSKPIRQDVTRMTDMAGGGNSMGTNIGRMIAGALKSMPPPQQVAAAASPAAPDDPFAEKKKEPEKNPLWEMLILRGGSQEKRSFPLSEVRDGEDAAGAAADTAATAAGAAATGSVTR
jgi:hypothetical protein